MRKPAAEVAEQRESYIDVLMHGPKRMTLPREDLRSGHSPEAWYPGCALSVPILYFQPDELQDSERSTARRDALGWPST